jgi:hypothetical protein
MTDKRTNDRLAAKSTPWHELELMKVFAGMRAYRLAYEIDPKRGTLLHVPGGVKMTIAEAESLGWLVQFPELMREFDEAE